MNWVKTRTVFKQWNAVEMQNILMTERKQQQSSLGKFEMIRKAMKPLSHQLYVKLFTIYQQINILRCIYLITSFLSQNSFCARSTVTSTGYWLLNHWVSTLNVKRYRRIKRNNKSTRMMKRCYWRQPSQRQWHLEIPSWTSIVNVNNFNSILVSWWCDAENKLRELSLISSRTW